VLILDEAGFRLKPDDIRQMSECSKPIGCLVYPKTTFMKQLNNGMMAVSSPPISTSLSDRLRLQIETVDGGIGKLHRLSVAGVPVYRSLYEAVSEKPIDETTYLNSHPDFAELTRNPNGIVRELTALKQGISYAEFDGNVGIVSLGGGVALYAIDAMKHSGLRPANYADFGSTFRNPAEKLRSALQLIASNDRIESCLLHAPVGGLFDPVHTDVEIRRFVQDFRGKCLVVWLGPEVHSFAENEARSVDDACQKLSLSPS
jgi:hypothetical protein